MDSGSSEDDQMMIISNKSLLLKPEEARIWDLLSFLVSGEIQSKEFIECLKVKETSLKRRGIIFISVLIQKILQAMSTPLQLSGTILEFWLNFAANNQILSVFRGYLLN